MAYSGWRHGSTRAGLKWKGFLNLSPPDPRFLFQLQAERLLLIQKIAILVCTSNSTYLLIAAPPQSCKAYGVVLPCLLGIARQQDVREAMQPIGFRGNGVNDISNWRITVVCKLLISKQFVHVSSLYILADL